MADVKCVIDSSPVSYRGRNGQKTLDNDHSSYSSPVQVLFLAIIDAIENAFHYVSLSREIFDVFYA